MKERRVDEAKRARDAAQAQFEKTYGLSSEQYNTSLKQFDQTFAEEQRINNKNLEFAQAALDKKDFLDSLFNPKAKGSIIGMTLPGIAANTLSRWF